MMNYLWSPWRMEYIQSHKNEEGCVFCLALAQPDEPDNLVVHVAHDAFVIMNRFPYTSGHLMVVPHAHVSSIEALEPVVRAEMMELAAAAMGVLRRIYRPQGFNLGLNIGEAAGAGIAEHVHLHVVPRWAGDTNFMSSLGQTRVLPEILQDTYQRVCAAWNQRDPE